MGSPPAIYCYSIYQNRAIIYEITELAIPEIKNRFLYNYRADFDSLCRRLLGLTPARQWYKIRLSCNKTQEVAVLCRRDIDCSGDLFLNRRLHHKHFTDFESICGRLFGSMPATLQYKVCSCHFKTQEIAPQWRGS